MTEAHSPSEPPGPPGAIVRSTGLLIAPFGDGAVVYDRISETTHVVDATAAWLLEPDEPATLAELVEMVVEIVGTDPEVARPALAAGIETLTGLGLLGRTEAPEPPDAMVPRVQEPEPGWTVGATHGLLDRRLAFCGPDASLIAEVDELFGAAITDAEPTMYFGLVPTDSGEIDVIDDSVWRLDDRRWLLWQLPSIVNYTVAHVESMVVLHAGAVRTPDGSVVVVTGPMNTGKSTLVAALVAAGCDYLGDESIGIDSDTPAAWAYPKPLTLDPSAQALVGLDPVGEELTAGEHRRADEINPAVMALQGQVGRIDLIVHTAYRPSEPSGSIRLDHVEALEVLLTNTLNLARAGERGLATLCGLAESVPVVAITHADSVALARHIVDVEADPIRVVESAVAPTVRSPDPAGGEPPVWWKQWAQVKVIPHDQLVTIPVTDGVLAVVPGVETRVLSPIQARICAESVGGVALEAIAASADDAGDGVTFHAEAALVQATRSLLIAGLVSVDRQPTVAVPRAPEAPPPGAGRRMIPSDPSSAQPADALGVPSTFVGFDPARRPGEHDVGTLAATTSGRTAEYRIATDVESFQRWLQDLPADLFDSARASSDDSATSIRVLSVPGSSATVAVILGGGLTWGPFAPESLPVALCQAVAELAGVSPPDGQSVGAAWVSPGDEGCRVVIESPGAVLDGPVSWTREVWLAADGTHVVTFDGDLAAMRMKDVGSGVLDLDDPELWKMDPLEVLVIHEDVDTAAERVAAAVDLFQGNRSVSTDALVARAVALVDIDKLVGVPARTRQTPPTSLPEPILPFTRIGDLGEFEGSIKLAHQQVLAHRMLWEWKLPDRDFPDLRRLGAECLAAFATGPKTADGLADLADHDGRFVIAIEPDADGSNARHKVYVELSEMSTWDAVTAKFPDTALLHDASVFPAPTSPGLPPRFVAWKRRGPDDEPTLAVYRRHRDPSVTVADAIAAVLPPDPDWLDAARALIGLDRDLDAPLGPEDLEVIEHGGRRSIDLSVSAGSPRGARIVVARWLAALSGVHGESAQLWVDRIARQSAFRLIVGTDAAGRPFLSVYSH